MKIAEFIKQKVAEAGTQTAVSRLTGVSQGTITKILSGDTTPELETIKKIATAYRVPITNFDEVAPHGIEKYRTVAANSDTTPRISEQLEGYSREVRIAADYMEVKLEGKTAEERMRYMEEFLETIKKTIK